MINELAKYSYAFDVNITLTLQCRLTGTGNVYHYILLFLPLSTHVICFQVLYSSVAPFSVWSTPILHALESCGDLEVVKVLFDTQRLTHLMAVFRQDHWRIVCTANGSNCRAQWPEFVFPHHFELKALHHHAATSSIYAVGNEVGCSRCT